MLINNEVEGLSISFGGATQFCGTVKLATHCLHNSQFTPLSAYFKVVNLAKFPRKKVGEMANCFRSLREISTKIEHNKCKPLCNVLEFLACSVDVCLVY